MDDALARLRAERRTRCGPSRAIRCGCFLPGYEGNTNVKWLRRLKVGDQPFQTREETSKYTDLMPDGTARQFTFIMEAKSVITPPSGGQRLRGPGFHEITGLAWSGRGRDPPRRGFDRWRRRAGAMRRLQAAGAVEVPDALSPALEVGGRPGALQAGPSTRPGYVQPTRAQLVEARGVNSFYHYNGIQTWDVAQTGR